MISAVRNILYSPKLLLEKIEEDNKDFIECSYTVSWNTFLKWNYRECIEIEDALAHLLCLWVKIQKDNADHINIENKDKTVSNLLENLFGVSEFDDLEITEINNQDCFHYIGKRLVGDHYSEKRRLKELESLKKAKGIAITCKTGDVLYFGKTRLFYFLVSRASLAERTLPVYKEIHEILFIDGFCESVRKRPAMAIGSCDRQGLHRSILDLIEQLLEDSLEKNITFKILTQDTLEIICESYFAENNSSYVSSISIASALSESFIWQDEYQEIRTEKGLLTSDVKGKGISKGIRMEWKPDASIFDDIHLNYHIILNRMIELAALNPYKISLADEQNQNTVFFENGIEALLKMNLFASDKIIHLNISDDEFSGEIVISFSPWGSYIRKSYVNSQITQDGGTHVEGMLLGVKKALKKILSFYKNSLSPSSFIEDISYVINIQIEAPRWHGATKRKLKNLEVKLTIQEQVEEQLYTFLKRDIEPLKDIYLMEK